MSPAVAVVRTEVRAEVSLRLAEYSQQVKSASTFITFSVSMALKVRDEIEDLARICSEAEKLTVKSKELAARTRAIEGRVGVFLDPDCSTGDGLRESCLSLSGFIPKILHCAKTYESDPSISRVHFAQISRKCEELASVLSELVVAMTDLHMAVIEHDAKGVESHDYKEAPDGEAYEIPIECLDASFGE